jgi:hypothetical protein
MEGLSEETVAIDRDCLAQTTGRLLEDNSQYNAFRGKAVQCEYNVWERPYLFVTIYITLNIV